MGPSLEHMAAVPPLGPCHCQHSGTGEACTCKQCSCFTAYSSCHLPLAKQYSNLHGESFDTYAASLFRGALLDRLLAPWSTAMLHKT